MTRSAVSAGAAIVGVALVGTMLVSSAGVGASTRTVSDESYEAQVLAGEWVHGENCAHCHGESGEGGEGPSLIGGRSLLGFRTAQRLFDFTSRSMPVDEPGTLAGEEYWAVVDYLLEHNGYNSEQVLVDSLSATDIVFN